jgi:ribonuclease VapC
MARTGCPDERRRFRHPMIVVDTSALMAVLLDESAADAIAEVLAEEEALVISAGTLVEALLVAEVEPVTEAAARRIADALARWGRGRHPAGLNFGDGFAYALAAERGCPVLCTGQDFAQTDLVVMP